MRLFLKKRLLSILIIWLILVSIQFLLVYLSLDLSRNFLDVRNEILTIFLMFFLLQFAFLLIINAVFPYYLKKYLSVIDNIVSEVSQGSYNLEIDIDEYKKLRDGEIVDTIDSFRKMMDIVVKFDSLKKQKIQEQKAKIVALLSLTENGFIILNKKGDVSYTNHLIVEYFPTIKEDINILETSFSLEIDNSIKSYITEVIKKKAKVMPKNLYMATSKKHITVKSEIVRDTNGEFDGTVVAIYNLDKKKETEITDSEDS